MMSVALSSADEDVIQRIIVVPSESDRTPRDILKNEYALETCLEWVIGNDFKRVRPAPHSLGSLGSPKFLNFFLAEFCRFIFFPS
jgi:hypothetical protein